MKFEPGNQNDMAYLIKHISPLHEHELNMCATANGVTAQTVLDMLAVWAEICGVWVAKDDKGRVIAVYSLRPDTKNPLVTGVWLFCTKWFFKDFRRNMRELRAETDRVAAGLAAKGKALQTLTYSQRPNAEKWAKVLGFTDVVEQGMYGRLFTRRA